MPSDRALRFLHSRERLGVKFGLENIRALAGLLADPQDGFRSVLVAGTNGKGSTAALLESILRASGLSTGLYTSPHIKDVEERIALSGKRIGRDELLDIVDRIAIAADTGVRDGILSAEPTFFETLTATAFEIFRAHRVDVAILEVGLGARLDATNIVPAITTIITPIGFDHQKILGHTLTNIAREKAAALRPRRPGVIANQTPEVLDVLHEYGESIGAELHEVAKQTTVKAHDEADGVTPVDLQTPQANYEALELPLLGKHQVANLAVAVRAAELTLRELTGERESDVPLELSARSVFEGVRSTCWPGRLERLGEAPAFLLDAAHNAMAAEALADYLDKRPASPRVLVFGVMSDKDYPEMLRQLVPRVDHLLFTRADSRRAMDPEELRRWAVSELSGEKGRPTLESFASSSVALARARELAGAHGEIVVSGSIYLLGELRPLIC